MSDEQARSRLAALLGTLTPKNKAPNSTKALNGWIDQAETKLGDEARGGCPKHHADHTSTNSQIKGTPVDLSGAPVYCHPRL